MEKKNRRRLRASFIVNPKNDTPGYLHPLHHACVRGCRHEYRKGLKEGSVLV